MFKSDVTTLHVLRFSHYLQRQHKLRLRAKAAEIQKELDDDRRTMEELQQLEEARREDDELKRERRRRELQWMSKVLTDQKEVERRRARQMEFMFAEEAESTWDKQERLWEEEKRARKVLMDDVVGGWKKQIQDRVDEARDRQRLLESERERLEEDIERLNGQIEEEERRNGEEKRRREEEMLWERNLRKMQADEEEKAKRDKDAGNFDRDNELADKLAKWNVDDQEPLGVSCYFIDYVRTV